MEKGRLHEKAINTRHGTIYVFDDVIGRIFSESNYYEEGKIKRAIEATSGFRTAIDIGANYGAHALVYASHFKQVIAFEPQPEVFRLLEKTLPDNCKPIQAAIGHRDGPAFLSEPFKTIGKRNNFGAAGITEKGQPIEMRTLDSYHLEDVDLIKIDVEGSERLVFYGARETIERNRPVILYENHNVVDFEKYGKSIQSFNIERFLKDVCRYTKLESMDRDDAYILAIP